MEILNRRPELTRHGWCRFGKGEGQNPSQPLHGRKLHLTARLIEIGCAFSPSIPTRLFIRVDLGSQYPVDTGPADTEPAGYLDRPIPSAFSALTSAA
jgi:hypothetical protein